jgi:hypothetical protein
VRDSRSLLTYTPAGASVIPVSTVTTDTNSPSSTTYFGPNGQITSQPTATRSSSSGSSRRGAGLVGKDLGKAFEAGIAVFIVFGII